MTPESDSGDSYYGQILLSAAVTTGFHPFSYVKTLIQLGYEPLAPVPSTSIFGRKVLKYPGMLKYLRVIRNEDGFFGMYRGLGSRLLGGTVGNMVTNGISMQIRGGPIGKKSQKPPAGNDELDGVEETLAEQIICVVKETSLEMVARCSGVIASQPFHVIMVRQMAQFAGKETEYNSIFSSISEIYHKEGILGFFAGIIPRLCGDVLAIWMANILAHLFNTYVMPKTGQGSAYMKSYSNVLSSLLASQVTYPFILVSNVMTVNNSGLQVARPVHDSWRDCWRFLARENALKRGSSIFMRYYKGPVTFRQDGSMYPAKY